MDKVSMTYLISFSRYQVLTKTVDDVIDFNIFLESTSEAMADREKEGKRQIQKI